ncbi:hypothetical protein TorRG33x02_014230 [Trema orientale]|uniref:Uncharacterized protein n=1 Tax=Trema orientale TaxID=63057 RepID=A0A2P5FXD0_TREOI|nr:hypothetical protein TorRG33x02_014230 [Trema orientale]
MRRRNDDVVSMGPGMMRGRRREFNKTRGGKKCEFDF